MIPCPDSSLDQLLNMSRVYHYIRGQTLIKLYVLTAMMEIFDKLLCSFGQVRIMVMYRPLALFTCLYCLIVMRFLACYLRFVIVRLVVSKHASLHLPFSFCL